MKIKEIILITLIIILLSLSVISAGWFDNKVSTSELEMENIDGFNTDEGNSGDTLSISNYDDKKHKYESLMVFETNSTIPYLDNNTKILKNFTNGSYISYMTNKNETIAFIIIENKTYECYFDHISGTEEPSEYNEKIFMQDNELLQKHMSTIRSK